MYSGLTGRCYLLAVVQRPAGGKQEARYVPYSTYAEFMVQERELSAKYKSSPTHTVESSVGICSCSEGTRLRKLEKARKSS
jgi:hypothetical protein